MKKIIKNIFLLSVVTLSVVACSKFTDGINVDPNNFTSAPGGLLIGQANLEVVSLFESQNSRVAGIFTDQFTGEDRQYIALNNYSTTAPDFDADWTNLYTYGIAQADLAEKQGASGGNKILEGVAQIVKGTLIAEAAALWGDVPYTQALDFTQFPNPTYDDQKSVLDAAQKLLSDGIVNVGSSKVKDAYGVPVFVGNSATWAKVGHSLKARYYLVAKDYTNALAEAKLGISSSAGDLLSSHSSANGAKNLFFQFVVEQRTGYLTVTGSHLFKLVTGVTPRLLATPGDANRATKYFNGTELNTNTGGYFAINASFPIISYVETKLIEAEAAYRTGGDALTPFNAVRNELATVYGGSFPASAASGNALLMQILEEKYISLIGSTQVFSDVRRTKNALGVPIKGTNATKIPQRFLYPQIEINSNKNFPGIVDLFTETAVNQ